MNGYATSTISTVTERQMKFVFAILRRSPFLTANAVYLANAPRIKDGTLGRKTASALIAHLLEEESVRDTASKPTTEKKDAAPGYYVEPKTNDFIVVVENKAKTRTYAKRLVLSTTATGRKTAKWEYAKGMGFAVSALSPMTREQAVGFGHLHGVCIICCKPLTVPASVKRGMGPTCAKKF